MSLKVHSKLDHSSFSNKRNDSDRYGLLEEWQQKREIFSVEIRKSKRNELFRKNRNEMSNNKNPQKGQIEEQEEEADEFIDFDEETDNESKPSQLISLSAANENNPWSSLSSRKQPNSDLVKADLVSSAIRNYLQNSQQSNFEEQLLYEQFRVDMNMKGNLQNALKDGSIKDREYNVEALAKTIQHYDSCPLRLRQIASIELFEYFQYENDQANASLKSLNYLIDIVLYSGCLLTSLQYLQNSSTLQSIDREELLCWLRVVGCVTRGNSQHCEDLKNQNLLQIFSRYLKIFQADPQAVEILAFIIGGLSAISLEWSYQFRLDNNHNLLLKIISEIPNRICSNLRMVRRVCLCINIFSKDMLEEMESSDDRTVTISIPPFEYNRIAGLVNIVLGEFKNDVKVVEYIFWALPLLLEMFLHNHEEAIQKQQLEQANAEENQYYQKIQNLLKKKKQITNEIFRVKQLISNPPPPAMVFPVMELSNSIQQIVPSFKNKLESLSRNLLEINKQMKSSIEAHKNNYDARHQFYLSTLIFRQTQDVCSLSLANQNQEQETSTSIDELIYYSGKTTHDYQLLKRKVWLLVCQMRIGEVILQGLGSKDKMMIISCLRMLRLLFLNGGQRALERLMEGLGQSISAAFILCLQCNSERFTKREAIKVISALLNSALPESIRSYYFNEIIAKIMRQLQNENIQYRCEVFQLLIQQLDTYNDEQFEELVFTREYCLFSVMNQVLRQANELDNPDMFEPESLISVLSLLNALLLSSKHTSGEDCASDRLRQILKLLYTNNIVQLVKKYEDHPNDIIHHLAMHFEGIFVQMLQEDEDEQLVQEITTALYEETNEPSSEMTPFNFPRDLR